MLGLDPVCNGGKFYLRLGRVIVDELGGLLMSYKRIASRLQQGLLRWPRISIKMCGLGALESL